ncbi:MAG: SDR family NAD(P)-dependent oxidoreductase, partial [Gammaproteobacteria bacterium]|nr:SDR family NAD(P)-dependent oxidoreductase [Gammaproteobacteria bacterium]
MNLEGRRVLVTAGAGGIGAVVARHFYEAGAQVHVCDIDAQALQQFSAAHKDIPVTVCDVADETAVDALFEEVAARFPALDTLVNNAGIAGPTGRIDTLQLHEWQRT